MDLATLGQGHTVIRLVGCRSHDMGQKKNSTDNHKGNVQGETVRHSSEEILEAWFQDKIFGLNTVRNQSEVHTGRQV